MNLDNEYLSVKKMALKYDLHPDTIRRKRLIEGVHYIRIGKSVRYHIKNMHKLLCGIDNTDSLYDKYLI